MNKHEHKGFSPQIKYYKWVNNNRRVSISLRNSMSISYGKKDNSFAPFLNNVECYKCNNYGHKEVSCELGNNSPPFYKISKRGKNHVGIQQGEFHSSYYNNHKRGGSNGAWTKQRPVLEDN